MSRLTANLRPVDEQRGRRLLVAWSTNDRLALDTVMDEAMREDAGVPALLFWLASFACALGEEVAEDFVDQLRAQLLAAEEDTP